MGTVYIFLRSIGRGLTATRKMYNVPAFHCQTTCPQSPRPLSIRRLIASARVGFGYGCRSIQAVILAARSAGMRTPVSGVMPVGGRPRGLF